MSKDVGTLGVLIWLLDHALSTWETHFLQLEKKIRAALPPKVIGKLPLDLDRLRMGSWRISAGKVTH